MSLVAAPWPGAMANRGSEMDSPLVESPSRLRDSHRSSVQNDRATWVPPSTPPASHGIEVKPLPGPNNDLPAEQIAGEVLVGTALLQIVAVEPCSGSNRAWG